MILRFAGGCLFAICMSVALGGSAAAQSSPVDPTTEAIIRAAAGIIGDEITRNRLNAANSTHGTVSYFRRYDMQVRTGTNRYRDVRLHPGTVIDPRGATPGTGTMVDISGRGEADGSLDADTIVVIR